MPVACCRELRGVFCDIDDTLTSGGRLPAAAFAALWRLREAGLSVVPVTGRPAGWCDHLARMWPVDAVVGENGAFYFAMGPTGMVRRWVQDEATREASRRKLDDLAARILAVVPEVRVAADQFCRASDLAIDFCEDVPAAGLEAIDRVLAIFAEAGASAKVSSIHVNGWFGDFDKLTTVRLVSREVLGVDLQAERERFLFVGDSPNDDPAFAFFPVSAGVANIQGFLPRMSHPPAYVARREGGEGFAEIVDAILGSRS
ncbi:MAG: HAD-IIB family hydrolase [Deltaproteobacteria bacterium]|nr:HAD-IIB family hydrolase [Deltaproteobacteria bacterium]